MLQEIINKVVDTEKLCQEQQAQAEQKAYDIVLEAKNKAEQMQEQFLQDCMTVGRNIALQYSQQAEQKASVVVAEGMDRADKQAKEAQMHIDKAIKVIIASVG